MAAAFNTEAFDSHSRYRVVYRDPGLRLPREIVGRFLGASEHRVYWDLRPEWGTVVVPRDWILEIWETDRELSAPQVYRGERRMF